MTATVLAFGWVRFLPFGRSRSIRSIRFGPSGADAAGSRPRRPPRGSRRADRRGATRPPRGATTTNPRGNDDDVGPPVCSGCFLLFANDPSAGSPTETLLRLLLPLNDKVRTGSVRGPVAFRPLGSPGVPSPRRTVRSVGATGGVYKGQGRNRRGLMTRDYEEFLVREQ